MPSALTIPITIPYTLTVDTGTSITGTGNIYFNNNLVFATSNQAYYTPAFTQITISGAWVGNWTVPVNWATGSGSVHILTPAEQAVQAAVYAKNEKARLRAKNKAEKLLLECLTPAQIIDFKTRRAFVMESASGKLFELREGRSRNIKLLGPDGKVQRTYCIHPGEAVPDCDTLLAQKLWLETNEAEFYKIANAS